MAPLQPRNNCHAFVIFAALFRAAARREPSVAPRPGRIRCSW